jgi:glucose-6-phosphate isomerase
MAANNGLMKPLLVNDAGDVKRPRASAKATFVMPDPSGNNPLHPGFRIARASLQIAMLCTSSRESRDRMSVHPRCDRTPSWLRLQEYFRTTGRDFDMRVAFAADPHRFNALSFEAPEVFVDLSKNLIDRQSLDLLLDLARECAIEERRNAMLSGAISNVTEGRPVLHTALRASLGEEAHSIDVHEVLDRMLAFAEKIRDTANSGIRNIVNIGIGGSDLGPQMAVPALDAFAHRGLHYHFVSNVDGHDIASVLHEIDPNTTLFIIASKTFTTQETMANANVAREWFLANGGVDTRKHFVATTTNVKAAAEFGIDTTFGFWDWVGGRYSMWSAIGLPIAIAIGEKHFRALLDGAHAMDRHFAETPLESNVPVLLGLIDVWYRNFHAFTSRSIAPYHQGLKRLPAYLQQLEMESNGKRVDLNGEQLPFATSPVVWGEPGTNGQHAYFQMLHQGTNVIPVEFILVRKPTHGFTHLHTKLLANGLAQSQALLLGKSAEEARTERVATASPDISPDVLAQHRTFPGNRPSTTLLLEEMTPHALGALIAMYEHRVFVSGALWNINSFDQWGVELGKALCNQLIPRLTSGDVEGLDSSTAGLLKRLI